MKLFLSSEGVARPDLLEELIGGKGRVALINNALDTHPAVLTAASRAALAAQFVLLGYEPVEVDLRTYEGKTEELRTLLRSCSLMWCAGGNSFWLRYVMKTSGFDSIIKDLLAEGIVYGGWSAGIVVAGPSLHPIELMDDPDKAPEVIYEGLGLIDCFLWPHWGREKYAHLEEEGLKRMREMPYECLQLQDGEVVIVQNGTRSRVR